MTYRTKTLRNLPPITRKFARMVNELESVERRLKNMTGEIARLESDSKALFAQRTKTATELGDLVMRLSLELQLTTGKPLIECTTSVLESARETIEEAVLDSEEFSHTVIDLQEITDPAAARRKLAHEILFPGEPYQENAAAELRSTAAARSDQHPQNAEKGETIND